MTFGARPRVLRRAHAALSLLLLVVLLAACSRQPVVLTGTVTDAYTGEPVPMASVAIGDTILTTDPNGAFSTLNWGKNDTLAINAPNYEPLSLSLEERPEIAATDVQTITLDTVIRPTRSAA